jgi:hypothetical protein
MVFSALAKTARSPVVGVRFSGPGRREGQLLEHRGLGEK